MSPLRCARRLRALFRNRAALWGVGCLLLLMLPFVILARASLVLEPPSPSAYGSAVLIRKWGHSPECVNLYVRDGALSGGYPLLIERFIDEYPGPVLDGAYWSGDGSLLVMQLRWWNRSAHDVMAYDFIQHRKLPGSEAAAIAALLRARGGRGEMALAGSRSIENDGRPASLWQWLTM